MGDIPELSEEEAQRRNDTLASLFTEWDIDGYGNIGLGVMLQVIQASDRMSNKEQKKWVKHLQAQIDQARRTNQSRGSLASLKLASGGNINFSEQTGEPSLDPDAFTIMLRNLTKRESPDEFDEFVDFCKQAIEEATSKMSGSKQKKEIWAMFRMLDRNKDGYVDLEEMEPLLQVRTKHDKKEIVKWKYYCVNKEHMAHPEDVTGDEDYGKFLLDLHSFQKFIFEFSSNDEERISEYYNDVKTYVQERQAEYIVQFKVHEIMNEIMSDLLREEPLDVLAGVQKSVERLQRTGKFPKMLAAKKRALSFSSRPMSTE